MYVIIGSHFVPLEGKFLLIALVIVRITLNVTVRQMPLNAKQRCVHHSKNCCQTFEHFDNVFAEEKITLSKCLRVILTITNAISKNLPSSVTKWLPIMTYIHPLYNIFSHSKLRLANPNLNDFVHNFQFYIYMYMYNIRI